MVPRYAPCDQGGADGREVRVVDLPLGHAQRPADLGEEGRDGEPREEGLDLMEFGVRVV